MGRKLHFVMWAYLACALLTEAMLVQDAYASGGFQRSHSIHDLLVLVAVYLATAILWPVLFAIVALQYFGVLPAILTLF
jgi:hypothetical protein